MSLTTTSKVLMIILGVWLLTVARSILIMFGGSRIFKKASKGEKTAFYPIINLFTMLDVVDISTFFGILLFVPGLNVIILIWMSYKLGYVFNTGIVYRLALVILPVIFYPALAFSDKSYKLTDEEYFKALDNSGSKLPTLETEEESVPEVVPDAEVEEQIEEVDSVFKANYALGDKTAPYKAVKIDLLGMEKLKEDGVDENLFKDDTPDEDLLLPPKDLNKKEEKKKDFEIVDL